ncbi:hypothetical protein [Saccharothrix sp. ALI-22-I]|uniref:hypothetical protein n=1 Tax=Saccharothrix sp. ALI-22-I TaxID=1933778 RepID=UPI0015C3D7C9|nr:hypothetical protein [Saccharothrix sp. ALI-22-I]
MLRIFPWVRHLPEAGREEFVVKLVEAMRSTAELDTNVPVATVIAVWKNTADIYADPELLAILTGPTEGDFGPVPMPVVEEE